MSGDLDLTRTARASLLDAVEALGVHARALTVVGAQAIYLRVGDAYSAVAPFTTDGDLMINPTFLAEVPDLTTAMQDAGFRLREGDVGVWESTRGSATIDLLVPAALGGPGRRAARLGPHGNKAAKKVLGLEGALVDRDGMKISALDPLDSRVAEVWVAGPSALLVSKLHKLADRQDQPTRLDNKDALDAFRILQGTQATELATRYRQLLNDERSSGVAARALVQMSELFESPSSLGSRMAADAVIGVDDTDLVAQSCSILTRELRALLD